MTVSANSPVTSTNVNSAFASKTANNVLIGIQTLNAPSGVSGPAISDVQLAINNSSVITYTIESIGSSGEVTATATGGGVQYRRVQSDGGAVVLSSTPFGSSHGLIDGQQVWLIGQSDADTIEIDNNDATDGCLLNGNAILQKNYMLKLIYDAVSERFIEIGRNF